MSMWKTKAEIEENTAIAEKMLANEQKMRVAEDREFWSVCLTYLVDEGMSMSSAEAAIKIADKLLEARRERFPL